MPVNNWTSVDAGIFHAFHHEWISAISRALNRGLLSSEFYALPEQYAGGYGPDVLTLQTPSRGIPNRGDSRSRATGTDVLESPPKTRFHVKSAPAWYATNVGGPSAEAYVDTSAVGDVLNLPVFLTPLEYVSLPLEETYLAAFDSLPEFWRDELNR